VKCLSLQNATDQGNEGISSFVWGFSIFDYPNKNRDKTIKLQLKAFLLMEA
jgi:hypothetical protein